MRDESRAWALARLRGLTAPGTISDAVRLGGLVVENVYGGSIQAVRSRARKHWSFRRLAAQPGITLTPIALWRAVSIYLLVQEVPWLARASHLRLSHVRATLSLSSPARERLLLLAEQGRWPKRRVEDESKRLRRAGDSRGHVCDASEPTIGQRLVSQGRLELLGPGLGKL